MVGTINTRSLLPKLSILMLTDLINIPEDLTQETSLNGKYLKGIPTAVTDPNIDIGNADHTHTSDGDHGHDATVPSHEHTGISDTVGFVQTGSSGFSAANLHTHTTSTNTQAVAEASTDGDHTHDTISNELEHRTITFYKKTNTSIGMNRKALPRHMTFFYSKTGTLPAGLLENLNYVDKHFKGDATPGTEAGSNTHQHDLIEHNHPTDISDHEHTISFPGAGITLSFGASGGSLTVTQGVHTHGVGTAATINKSSTPVTSGDDSGHQHDDISHEPDFKTLRLMEVNSVKMSNVGVPKNCIFLWLDLISLIVSGWQVSDGNNDTIDLLDVFPKGNAIPDTLGGNDEHTHSEDTASHSHTGADVGHSHGTTGSSAIATEINTNKISGAVAVSGSHGHTPGSVGTQAAQTITITNGASDHDHGSISNEPEAKTIAFIERING